MPPNPSGESSPERQADGPARRRGGRVRSPDGIGLAVALLVGVGASVAVLAVFFETVFGTIPALGIVATTAITAFAVVDTVVTDVGWASGSSPLGYAATILRAASGLLAGYTAASSLVWFIAALSVTLSPTAGAGQASLTQARMYAYAGLVVGLLLLTVGILSVQLHRDRNAAAGEGGGPDSEPTAESS
jgi:hypothetical protein